jgi:hypothetical protein
MKPYSLKTKTRQFSGRQAQSNGAIFEAMFFTAAARQGMTATRIPDGCKQLPNRRIIRVKTPFDWMLTHNGQAIVCDTKRNDAKTFPHARIDHFQVHHLLLNYARGINAGYIVWLATQDLTMFVPAPRLSKGLTTRGSICPSEPDVTVIGNGRVMDLAKVFDLPNPNRR